MKISDVDDKMKVLNYFGEIEEEIKKEHIYCAPMFVNKDGWLNLEYGKSLIKISDIM